MFTFTKMESDDVPSVITAFYNKLDFTTAADGKVKLIGHCKKCSKAISANWKPQRVTSNLISHVKVCKFALLCNFRQILWSRNSNLWISVKLSTPGLLFLLLRTCDLSRSFSPSY